MVRYSDLPPEVRRRVDALVDGGAAEGPSVDPVRPAQAERLELVPMRCHTCGATVAVPDASDGDPFYLDDGGRPVKDGRRYRRHTKAVCRGTRFEMIL